MSKYRPPRISKELDDNRRCIEDGCPHIAFPGFRYCLYCLPETEREKKAAELSLSLKVE